jgi:CheY-like chemotaxis protein
MDGLSVCTQLRADSSVPIIIVSARDSEIDRIRASPSAASITLSSRFALELWSVKACSPKEIDRPAPWTPAKYGASAHPERPDGYGTARAGADAPVFSLLAYPSRTAAGQSRGGALKNYGALKPSRHPGTDDVISGCAKCSGIPTCASPPSGVRFRWSSSGGDGMKRYVEIRLRLCRRHGGDYRSCLILFTSRWNLLRATVGGA